MFGNISWNDADNVRRQILEIPGMVGRDEQYRAMRNSDNKGCTLEKNDRKSLRSHLLNHGRQHGTINKYTGNLETEIWLATWCSI